jgi:hypothetical protein
MITYEQQLDRNLDWALTEGSMHFDKGNAVHKTLRKITKRLEDLQIPYAVVGGMALFFHGFRRFTEDVDILVTPEGLTTIHSQLEGLGYVPPFAGSKHLRDTENGVRVEFLVSGSYPGDGKPKPVAFPNPEEASVTLDDIRFLSLPKLIELKLASGMTNPNRLKDLADAQQLIEVLKLPEELANQLNPFVQDKYSELWTAVQNHPSEP